MDHKANRIITERLKSKACIKAPDEEEIKTYFQQFGTIVGIRGGDEYKNIGFVDFSNASEAERALEQPIHRILGCEIRVFACGRTHLPK